MNDPLAQYRRSSTAPATGGVPPTEGAGEYLAYGTKDKVHRLRIRNASSLTHSPGYNLLVDVVYDGDYGTNVVLVYTVLMVRVEGKNLQKLVFAIENGMADFIQEFDAHRWAKPADAKAPFIESIEVKVREGGSSSADMKH